MTMNPQHVGGNEEDWTHKMLWILSKITNFRSEAQRRYPETSVHAEQVRLHQRQQQWLGLKQFCDRWQNCIPPTMHALAYVPNIHDVFESSFPELWFIRELQSLQAVLSHSHGIAWAVHPLAGIQPQLRMTCRK